MRVDNQSSTFYLLKLAFRSAKINPRQVLTTVLLILLVTTGSLYITNQIYQGNKQPKLSPLSTPEPTKEPRPTNNKKKKPVSVGKSSRQPQLLYIPLRLRQERRRKRAASLKSRLQISALDKFKINSLESKSMLSKQGAEKLARHELILTPPDEAYSPPPEEEWVSPPEEERLPPPPKQKPGFWGKLAKELSYDLKTFYRDLFNPIPDADRTTKKRLDKYVKER